MPLASDLYLLVFLYRRWQVGEATTELSPYSLKTAINPSPASLILASFRNISFKGYFVLLSVIKLKLTLFSDYRKALLSVMEKKGDLEQQVKTLRYILVFTVSLVNFYIPYSTLRHLPPLHNAEGCWI
jgi:hypothetical protein